MVKNLKLLRNQKGVSQQALASELGISQQSINKYENHNIEPDISTLISMADYFNTTVDYLIGRTDSDKTREETGNDEILITGYNNLNDREKKCIENIIDIFNSSKRN